MTKPSPSLAGQKLVGLIVEAAEEKLAEKITVIDHSHSTAFATADFFVVCQSDTGVQNRAIADAIIRTCKEKNTAPWHYEGTDEGRWVLIDFSDVVVHIMLPDVRAYYDLESLWETGVRKDIRKK